MIVLGCIRPGPSNNNNNNNKNVIIGSLYSVPEGLKDQLQTLQIYHANLILKMQKSVLLSSRHILRHFVTEH